MKVVYLTSGTTGSGRIVRGISIGNAFKRKRVAFDFTILHNSDFSIPSSDYPMMKLPVGKDSEYLPDNYKKSVLYNTLNNIKPDILIVDLLWVFLHNFIEEFSFKKIFLHTQVDDRYFSMPLQGKSLRFEPSQYNAIISAEPIPVSLPVQRINPIIIRNRDEIFTREQAIHMLGISDDKQLCLFAFNGEPGEFERIKKMYEYLEDEGYSMIYSTNYNGGLFPAVDYFNAFDLIICGAGYNAFWEAIYFDKEAIFVPVPRIFENQKKRIELCQEYYFDENGADQLVDIIMGM